MKITQFVKDMGRGDKIAFLGVIPVLFITIPVFILLVTGNNPLVVIFEDNYLLVGAACVVITALFSLWGAYEDWCECCENNQGNTQCDNHRDGQGD